MSVTYTALNQLLLVLLCLSVGIFSETEHQGRLRFDILHRVTITIRFHHLTHPSLRQPQPALAPVQRPKLLVLAVEPATGRQTVLTGMQPPSLAA